MWQIPRTEGRECLAPLETHQVPLLAIVLPLRGPTLPPSSTTGEFCLCLNFIRIQAIKALPHALLAWCAGSVHIFLKF